MSLKLPDSATKGHEIAQRHYCLKFGVPGTASERIEVRDRYFERIGHCPLQDAEGIALLLGRPLDQQLLDHISGIPHGQITAIEL